ncbi:DUF3892 domain-containing protein [Paludicola sp. MB14-C6]|uniref:DUF3892 domain-containing protein n=1 Tax=Paludihabitans sp. MB14-C6 TaxID=3070656 RepID=UPI0027DCB36C|nr:DUF3892 domain-containing protein [Paludicola sp. MB14-C6]WMJ23380.1 DUF3892 domain-containing protein [Paludicola sp. MB14-C6]
MNEFNIKKLPLLANKQNPIPNPDAQKITAVVKHGNQISGYQLSNGDILTKEQGVDLAKSGGIKGVGIATNKGNEYLRSLPDESEGNNLSSLPVIND